MLLHCRQLYNSVKLRPGLTAPSRTIFETGGFHACISFESLPDHGGFFFFLQENQFDDSYHIDIRYDSNIRLRVGLG